MTDGELRFPHWQAPLEDLTLEFDPVNLQEKIRAVEALLFGRLQQLDPSQRENCPASALPIARIMKRDRLDSPQSE